MWVRIALKFRILVPISAPNAMLETLGYLNLCILQELDDEEPSSSLSSSGVQIAPLLLTGLSVLVPIQSAIAAPTLRIESSGPEVAQLQDALKRAGYLSQDTPTGYFGSLTEAAVMQFQQGQGLVADGIAGSQTQAVLFQQSAHSSNNGSTVLKLGMQGPSVMQLQDDLRNAGFFSDNSTGYFGELTEAAVIRFQQSRGLVADGVVGGQTQTELVPSVNGNARGLLGLLEISPLIDSEYRIDKILHW